MPAFEISAWRGGRLNVCSQELVLCGGGSRCHQPAGMGLLAAPVSEIDAPMRLAEGPQWNRSAGPRVQLGMDEYECIAAIEAGFAADDRRVAEAIDRVKWDLAMYRAWTAPARP